MLFFLLHITAVVSLKILIYNPKYAWSHMAYLGGIADSLQMAGHNVTVFQPEILTHYKKSGSNNVKVISIPPSEATVNATKIITTGTFWKDAWVTGELWGTTALPHMLKSMFKNSCRDVLFNEQIIQQFKEEKFDLGINEFFDYCGFPFFHEIGLHNVAGSSSYVLLEWASLAMGVPVTSYIPAAHGATGDQGTLYDRAKNLLFLYHSYQFHAILASAADEVAREKDPSIPTVWEITRQNISFCFTHSNPLIDFPKPTLYGIIDLGGIGLQEPKPLEGEWLSTVALRPKTVLVSFGSVAPSYSMPLHYKKNLLKVFSMFPEVTFIWKYEKPEEPEMKNHGENVILTKWMSQNDLLASGKIALFVTHGGSNSVTEASTYGVPVIVVPLFSDQIRNARMMERLGNGAYFCKTDLGKEELLYSALQGALENPRIYEAAKEVKDILKKKPFTPQELLVRHIEVVAAAKGGKLLPAGRHLGWLEYFNVDIIFIFLSLLLGVVYAVIRVFSMLRSVKKPKTE